MPDNVVRFPYSASRRVYSRNPRRSKNGTPEERTAKVAAEDVQLVSAPIVDLSERMTEAPADKVDRRKLRSSPLREKVGPISFAVTVTGKLSTADLRQEPLDMDAVKSEGWLHNLRTGANDARFVADELDKAAERLSQLQGQSEKAENSDSPVNLAVTELGQSVLNQIADGDQ